MTTARAFALALTVLLAAAAAGAEVYNHTQAAPTTTHRTPLTPKETNTPTTRSQPAPMYSSTEPPEGQGTWTPDENGGN